MWPEVRPAQPEDRDAVFELAVAFATSGVPTPPVFARSFEESLASAEALILVAERNGKVMGYLLGFVHPTFYANAPVGWVEEIMVSEQERRSGAGTALMAAFEQWSRGRAAQFVSLATRRAAHFYEALGYQESATYFRKSL